jgi:saccharopine dehydrogenase-like NADP-dependent oxidoreductase
MKKILVLGGVGAMATETSHDLIETSDFGEITIADIDLRKAEAFVQNAGDKRLKVAKVDAEDVARMAELMAGYDIVANGLPRIYCENAIRAAIKAQVDMLDLISPHQETLALNGEAQKAGISIVGGVGMTPGLTNILAKLGSERLDTVESIDIDFAAFRGIAYSPGLLHVILWEFDPKTKDRSYYENGEFVDNPPFAGARVVHFPEPIGTQTTYYVPHGEPRTLSKNTPGVKRVCIRGCFPPEAMAMCRVMYAYGTFTKDPIEFEGRKISADKFLRHYLTTVPEGNQTSVWGYSVQVEVCGTSGKNRVMHRFVTTHPPMKTWGGTRAYAKNVGIPMSVGAQMMARGLTMKKGVDGVESMLPAQEFADELRKRSIAINESLIYL